MSSLARKQNYRAVMRSSGQTGERFHGAVLKLGSAGGPLHHTLVQDAGGVPAAKRCGLLALLDDVVNQLSD